VTWKNRARAARSTRRQSSTQPVRLKASSLIRGRFDLRRLGPRSRRRSTSRFDVRRSTARAAKVELPVYDQRCTSSDRQAELPISTPTRRRRRHGTLDGERGRHSHPRWRRQDAPWWATADQGAAFQADGHGGRVLGASARWAAGASSPRRRRKRATPRWRRRCVGENWQVSPPRARGQAGAPLSSSPIICHRGEGRAQVADSFVFVSNRSAKNRYSAKCSIVQPQGDDSGDRVVDTKGGVGSFLLPSSFPIFFLHKLFSFTYFSFQTRLEHFCLRGIFCLFFSFLFHFFSSLPLCLGPTQRGERCGARVAQVSSHADDRPFERREPPWRRRRTPIRRRRSIGARTRPAAARVVSDSTPLAPVPHSSAH